MKNYKSKLFFSVLVLMLSVVLVFSGCVVMENPVGTTDENSKSQTQEGYGDGTVAESRPTVGEGGNDDDSVPSENTGANTNVVSDELIREVKYIAGLSNGYAWVVDNDKYILTNASGTVLSESEDYEPYCKINSTGYTLMNYKSSFIVVNNKGDIVASEEELGVEFVVPEVNGSYMWYENELSVFEDGYILAYSIEETYNSVTYKIGVLGTNGEWIVKPSSDHPILNTEFDVSESEIKDFIIYSNNGIFSFKTAWNKVSFYDVKQNKVIGSVNLLDVDISIEEFNFVCGRTIWKDAYSHNTYYYSITPDGSINKFLTANGSPSYTSGVINDNYFWVDEKLYSRETLSEVPVSKYQLYYDQYANGVIPELIDNSEGTTFYGVKNSDGYIFDPIKVPFTSYNCSIKYDGKYAVFVKNNTVYIYDYKGNMINQYELQQYASASISNGVVRCKYNYRTVYVYVTETPDKYF